MLQVGTNTKLGPTIGAFSLPALETCPGKTEYCKSVCYATTGFFRFGNVKNSLAKNYAASLSDTFVDEMNKEIKKAKVSAIRIHPAGDFYSTEYITKWHKIIQTNSGLKFWCYTRSWRIPELLPVLEQLKTNSNLELFASVDFTTKDVPPNWRIADVVTDWTSIPENAIRCPNQKNQSITCDKCTYCFKPAKTKKDIVFLEH